MLRWWVRRCFCTAARRSAVRCAVLARFVERVQPRENAEGADAKNAVVGRLATIISKNGNVSSPRIISEIQPGRVSGYPQMEKVNDQVMFAWTELEKESIIKTKWFAISSFR